MSSVTWRSSRPWRWKYRSTRWRTVCWSLPQSDGVRYTPCPRSCSPLTPRNRLPRWSVGSMISGGRGLHHPQPPSGIRVSALPSFSSDAYDAREAEREASVARQPLPTSETSGNDQPATRNRDGATFSPADSGKFSPAANTVGLLHFIGCQAPHFGRGFGDKKIGLSESESMRPQSGRYIPRAILTATARPGRWPPKRSLPICREGGA